MHALTVVLTVASPDVGNWGTCAPLTYNDFFLVHFGVNLTANYPGIV